jgi:hypothetical protein
MHDPLIPLRIDPNRQQDLDRPAIAAPAHQLSRQILPIHRPVAFGLLDAGDVVQIADNRRTIAAFDILYLILTSQSISATILSPRSTPKTS